MADNPVEFAAAASGSSWHEAAALGAHAYL